jgi:hypothetical protein
VAQYGKVNFLIVAPSGLFAQKNIFYFFFAERRFRHTAVCDNENISE